MKELLKFVLVKLQEYKKLRDIHQEDVQAEINMLEEIKELTLKLTKL